MKRETDRQTDLAVNKSKYFFFCTGDFKLIRSEKKQENVLHYFAIFLGILYVTQGVKIIPPEVPFNPPVSTFSSELWPNAFSL